MTLNYLSHGRFSILRCLVSTEGSTMTVNYLIMLVRAIVRKEDKLYYRRTSAATVNFCTPRFFSINFKLFIFLAFPLQRCNVRTIASVMTVSNRRPCKLSKTTVNFTTDWRRPRQHLAGPIISCLYWIVRDDVKQQLALRRRSTSASARTIVWVSN